MKNHALLSRFCELAELDSGVQERCVLAPDNIQLGFVAEKFANHYPGHLPLPALVLTQEGDLLLEWHGPGDPSLDIILGSLDARFHSFGESGEDMEREFSLLHDLAWNQLFGFLGEHIRTHDM